MAVGAGVSVGAGVGGGCSTIGGGVGRRNCHIRAPARIAHSRNPNINPWPAYRSAAAGEASGGVLFVSVFCAGRGPMPAVPFGSSMAFPLAKPFQTRPMKFPGLVLKICFFTVRVGVSSILPKLNSFQFTTTTPVQPPENPVSGLQPVRPLLRSGRR